MNSKQLAVVAAKQEIQTREQFHKALAHVNALVKRPDITVDAAKVTLTKAEALRAWASFDRRLTVEEKKEANRALTRTVRMLAELAEREQPSRSLGNMLGRTPGPNAWLRRELGMTPGVATYARMLVTQPDFFRVALESGKHWATVIAEGSNNGNRSRRRNGGPLGIVLGFVSATNTLARALKIPSNHLARELSRIRKIRAWCEAYEHALLQRKAGLAK